MGILKSDKDNFTLAGIRAGVGSRLMTLKEYTLGNPVSVLKLYSLGYKVAIGGLIFCLILSSTYPEHVAHAVPAIALGVLLLWGTAFLIEVVARVPTIVKNKYFLSFLALVSVPVLKISSLWVGRFVNDTTGVDPRELPDAVSALFAVFVPLTWLYVFFALLALVVLAMLTVGALWSSISHSPAQGREFFARLLVTIFLVTYGFIFAEFLSRNSVRLGEFLVVAAEYFEDARCMNLNEHELVARLESGASIFNSETNEFRFATCQG